MHKTLRVVLALTATAITQMRRFAAFELPGGSVQCSRPVRGQHTALHGQPRLHRVPTPLVPPVSILLGCWYFQPLSPLPATQAANATEEAVAAQQELQATVAQLTAELIAANESQEVLKAETAALRGQMTSGKTARSTGVDPELVNDDLMAAQQQLSKAQEQQHGLEVKLDCLASCGQSQQQHQCAEDQAAQLEGQQQLDDAVKQLEQQLQQSVTERTLQRTRLMAMRKELEITQVKLAEAQKRQLRLTEAGCQVRSAALSVAQPETREYYKVCEVGACPGWYAFV